MNTTLKQLLRRCLASVMMILLFLPLSAFAAVNENLITNGDFEAIDEEGIPEFWFTDAYVHDEGYTVFSVADEGGERGCVAEIRNIGENDARFAQEVEVEPESLYCLSGWIRADGIEGGHGANLSIEGVYAFSEKVYDTEGEWEYIEYYGETGPNQDLVTVFVRLGGYSGTSTGTAFFDDISLTQVNSVPGEAVADLWFREDTYDSGDEEETEEGEPASFRLWLAAISVLFLFFLGWLYHSKYLTQAPDDLQQKNRKRYVGIAEILLLLSLAIRLLISAMVEGYMVDVNCFLSWGHTFASVGPAGFYEATNFCDYPPLYTYILGLNSLVARLLGGSTAVTRIVFRFIPCVCDVAACWMLFRMMLRRERIHPAAALLVTVFLSMNPATILNSAAWGQMDSVLCLLLLAVSLYAVEGKWAVALPLYVVSVLVKPQALMLGPLGLSYIIITLIREKDARKRILAGTGIGIAVLAAGVIPFSLRQNWDWLITLYSRTLASYPYATVNTANLYYLLGGNWASVGSTAPATAPILLSAFCVAYTLWQTFAFREQGRRIPEICAGSVFAAAFLVYAFIGASWTLNGATAMGFAFAVILCPVIRNRRISMLPYLGALLFILLYVFGVKMHERYLFPAILLLGAAYMLHTDRRILIILGMFSVTLFVNEGIVLDNSIRLGSSLGHLNNDTVWIADLLSIANILTSFYAVWLTEELTAAKTDGTVLPVRERHSAHHRGHRDRSLHWKTKDTVLLACVTAVYALISLLTLGSASAPQSVWTSSSTEEQVIFDLGEVKEDFSILYFAQVSRNDFYVSVSADGENWDERIPAQMDEGQCWKWKYVTYSVQNGTTRTYSNNSRSSIVLFSGRYVRLSPEAIGLKLCEILFRDSDGNTLPATIVSHLGANEDSELYSDPSAMTDEQDTLESIPHLFVSEESGAAEPSWWNSTYFDEIYHARTAYEFLHGTVPYETSHPPLGKVLMSACVAVFGMTPFGWRFAGALAGILLLPGMYLLVKQLTKRTWIAVSGCLLMALDCLHLTQTQIATIDSFPVLFILFSFFFMLRFLQTDPYREKASKSLASLGLSGLFMGLSIASKWIGIYAGCGLAVLYFWHCFRMLSAFSADNGPSAVNRAWRRFFVLCLWCVLFFIAVPVLIYLLSYIPYFTYDQRIRTLSDYLTRVWNAQIGMFNYHSTPGLGMDHPFYSPWWEWPVIGKPMYYAQKSYLPDESSAAYSIFAIGNPVIWYGALGTMLCCLGYSVMSRRYRLPSSPDIWHRKENTADPSWQFLFVGILAQYLPWVLVPRGTYIYHYFASLPFLMVSVCLCMLLLERKTEKAGKWFAAVFLTAAAVMFILLFPYASGIAVPKGWLDIGRNLLRIWY